MLKPMLLNKPISKSELRGARASFFMRSHENVRLRQLSGSKPSVVNEFRHLGENLIRRTEKIRRGMSATAPGTAVAALLTIPVGITGTALGERPWPLLSSAVMAAVAIANVLVALKRDESAPTAEKAAAAPPPHKRGQYNVGRALPIALTLAAGAITAGMTHHQRYHDTKYLQITLPNIPSAAPAAKPAAPQP